MIKLIAVGLWVMLVTLGASYAVATVFAPQAGATAEGERSPDFFAGLDYRQTTNITVPMIDEHRVRGYILAQFIYTIDGGLANELAVPPDPIIVDAAFRRLYAAKAFDFDDPTRYDLDGFLGDIRTAVNERYGREIVYDVMVEQFDYVATEDVRGRRPEER